MRSFVDRLPSLVNEIEPLVDASSRPLGNATLLNLVTERCLRIDIVVTGPETIASAQDIRGAQHVQLLKQDLRSCCSPKEIRRRLGRERGRGPS